MSLNDECTVCISNKLWSEHIYLTREIIVTLNNGGDNASDVIDDIVKMALINANKICNFIDPKSHSKNLQKFFQEHLSLTGDVLKSIFNTSIANDDESDLDLLMKSWVLNVDELSYEIINLMKKKVRIEEVSVESNDIIIGCMREHLVFYLKIAFAQKNNAIFKSLQLTNQTIDMIITMSKLICKGLCINCKCKC